MKQVIPFLMFNQNGKVALDFYAATLPYFEIEKLEMHQENPSLIKKAIIKIENNRFRIADSANKQDFDFTPSFSIMLEMDSELELEQLASKLVYNGLYLMPIDSYPFASKFCWIQDQFNISWQLIYNEQERLD